MLNTPFSRRELLAILKGTAALGAAAIIAPSLFTGCQKKPEEMSDDVQGNTDNNFTVCPPQNLSPEQIARRQNLKYVDESPIRTRTCANCKLYVAAAKSQCGGCTVVPGLVHPKGWCSSWYYRM
jgi:hypothetical protein